MLFKVIAIAIGASLLLELLASTNRRDAEVEADGHVNSDGDPDPGMPEDEVQQVWEAACAGDAPKVQRLLRKLPAEMEHPGTGSSLLLDVAAVRTCDATQDRRLGEVMAVLINGGASLRRRLFPVGNTALHLLAAQPRLFRVHHRVLLLLDQSYRNRSATSMLSMRNANHLKPEDIADLFRPDLGALLKIWRILICRAREQRRGVGPLQLLEA